MNETTDKRVLDPCCGSRMMWFDRANSNVVFGDNRRETVTVTDRSHGNATGQRVLRVEPDVPLDFRALPYADGTFRLVVFDPPHLVHAGPRSWLAAKYGKLGENWRDDLRRGFAECFRVLATDGVLVFKWNETQVKVTDVLALTPIAPLFGHPTGRKGLTHWLVFMRPSRQRTRNRITLEAGCMSERSESNVGLTGLLGAEHTGMKISASGILGRIRDGRYYEGLNYGCGVMLGHLEQMASRFYAGDPKGVDEFLQLYDLADARPETPNNKVSGGGTPSA